MSAAREILHGFKNALLELLERTLRLAGQKLLESRDAEELVIGIHGLGHTIAEKDERVAGLQLEAGGAVFGFGNQADGKGTFSEGFFGDAAADQERRRVAGVDEFQMAVVIEDAEEHRGVAPDLRVIAKKTIHMVEDARGIRAQSHAGERALKHGGEKSGAKSFAGNVGNEKRSAPIAERKDVEIVASHR